MHKAYLTQSPFQDVRPIGRAHACKPQLRLDEAKRHRETALRLFDEHNNRLALAAVLPLYLGLRASEVVGRRVRDIDSGGSIIWIDRGKRKSARRIYPSKPAGFSCGSRNWQLDARLKGHSSASAVR